MAQWIVRSLVHVAWSVDCDSTWCADHDVSADSEEINEKNSMTPVSRHNSFRTRRHQAARREPVKDANRLSDDTVFYLDTMQYSHLS